jgi:hypothetical protein
MNDIMQQIVNYYQNYKNDIIPNDDLIAIIFNFKIMASIEKIDDMIINKYGDNMTDRLDFYNHIYHHHIMDIIIKQIEYKDDKNYFIISMIFVELHKCNLTNHIIESSFEDNIAAQAKLINKKKMYSKMITKLVELADKEKEMYSNIIDLVETNKHMYN